MTNKEKMINGHLYDANDPVLVADRARARQLTERLNKLPMAEAQSRLKIFQELLGETGESFFIENRFQCNYGYNITLGDNFYANFDCLFLDDAPITIGANVMFAPGVHVYTASHQLMAEERASGLEFARPVSIGDHAWIGGRVVINPGVTIGSGAVIGSGSVVTRDIPANTLAAGNPCRVIRPITEADRMML